jgi:hypothetical protein
VLTQDTVQPDSDEDERDIFKAPRLSVTEAMSHVRALREYAVAKPEKFSTADVKALDDMMSKIVAMSLLGKKQSTLSCVET